MANAGTQIGGPTSSAAPPVVNGTRGNQQSYAGQTLTPFSGVTITDGGLDNQIYVGVNDDLSVCSLLAGPGYG